MLTRLQGCLLASNDWVFFQDDDMLVSEEAIRKLVLSRQEDPDRVTCLVGRAIGHDSASGRFSYVMADVKASALVPVCLPHAMLTDRRFCDAALRKAPIMQDVAEQGRPYWSAEDIWHSLVALNTTSKLHSLLTTPQHGIKHLPSPHGISTTTDPNGTFHWQDFRSYFAHEAAERLGLSADTLRVQPGA